MLPTNEPSMKPGLKHTFIRHHGVPWITPRPRANILPHTAEAGDAYFDGDIYDRVGQQQASKPEQDASEYLSYIRRISRDWPYMRYLENFLDVTCAPPKRRLLNESDKVERASRMRVALLSFCQDEPVKRTNFETLTELHSSLETAKCTDKPQSHLFVVEDLSRDVIETLDATLDVDPRFFRAHISDYLWYNTKDPWVELPELETLAMKRDFFQMRYVQPRYFKTHESYERARTEAGGFNVLRRIDMEIDRVLQLDDPDSVVGMVRSKASLWTRPRQGGQQGTLGVLLLDPPIQEGFSLWGGYCDFNVFTTIASAAAYEPQPPNSAFEDFIYWTQTFTDAEKIAAPSDPCVLAIKALLLICANWRATLEYAKTRITQIEWEIESPALRLVAASDGLDACMRRLYRWRRVLPIYQSMVEDVLFGVIDKPHRQGESAGTNEMRQDFLKILNQIAQLQRRCESIASLVGAMISIQENRKTVQQNANLTRLTYLACLFIPMSFLSSLFSMNGNLGTLTQTFWIYFAVAIPLTAVCVAVTLLVYSDRFVLSKIQRPR